MNTINESCVYCGIQRKLSDDHIFPQSIGGTYTIRACEKCNNEFGSKFESKAFDDLKSVLFSFRVCGIKEIWNTRIKQLNVDTIEYSINESFDFIPSKPEFSTNEKGEILFANGNEKYVKKLLKTETIKNPDAKFECINNTIEFDLSRSWDVSFDLNTDSLKKMAFKASYAFAKLMKVKLVCENIYDTNNSIMKSLIDTTIFLPLIIPNIINRRRPLSHIVFIFQEGDSVYGIVELYGVPQYICKLGAVTEKMNYALMLEVNPIDKTKNMCSAICMKRGFPIKIVYKPSIQLHIRNFIKNAIDRELQNYNKNISKFE